MHELHFIFVSFAQVAAFQVGAHEHLAKFGHYPIEDV